MEIAKGLEMLEISAVVMGKVQVIYPTLIWDNENAILVDTGYPGQLPLIRETVEKTGIPFNKLNKVILTHQDIDHIGNLPAIVSESHNTVEVLSHALEKPYIQGEKMLIKITPEVLAGIDATLPPEMPEALRKAFKATLENPPKAKVDKTVADGEEFPYGGGITVIHTPGHTPGHICLYHQPSKTLISGDTLNIAGGQLHGPNPQHTKDMDQATQSLKKLAQYDIENVITYHGGLFRGNANQRIAQLANAQ